MRRQNCAVILVIVFVVVQQGSSTTANKILELSLAPTNKNTVLNLTESTLEDDTKTLAESALDEDATTLAEEQRQDLGSPQIGRIAQRLIETGSKKGRLDGPTLRQVLTFLKQALTAVNRQLRMTSKQAGRRRRRR